MFLPGLDGTGHLFGRCLGLIEPSHKCVVVRYPVDAHTLYDLVDVVKRAIEIVERPVIVAESFSSAVLLRLLTEMPGSIRAAVFVAGFAATPHRRLLRAGAYVPERVARMATRTLVRHFCLNGESDFTLCDEAMEVIAQVPHLALVRRMGMLRDMGDERIEALIPTLALNASRERVIDQNSRAAILKRLPRTKAVEIDGPHFLLQAAPVKCWGEIEAFANGVA